MGIVELILVAIGLSMDAFAVAVCKGLSMSKINYKNGVIIALFFGGFQALMPFIGWVLGAQFQSYISNYDHWIVFALLAFIGGKMLVEAFKHNSEQNSKNGDKLNYGELTMLAVATSIDALAVGISLALLPGTNIGVSVCIIGIITFTLSLIGVIIGNKLGTRYEKTSQIVGGCILILLGIKILIEHLMS